MGFGDVPQLTQTHQNQVHGCFICYMAQPYSFKMLHSVVKLQLWSCFETLVLSLLELLWIELSFSKFGKHACLPAVRQQNFVLLDLSPFTKRNFTLMDLAAIQSVSLRPVPGVMWQQRGLDFL